MGRSVHKNTTEAKPRTRESAYSGLPSDWPQPEPPDENGRDKQRFVTRCKLKVCANNIREERGLRNGVADLTGEVGYITSPTLVIHGEEARYMPPANARALVEAIEGAKLRLLEDAGLLVFVERFADVDREVVRFLKSSEARASRTGGGAAEVASREPEGWLRRSMRAVRGWNARMKAAVRVF